MDISWLSAQAKDIHSFFVSIFYGLTALLLVIGVIIDYFKMPIGGVPTFGQLVGRALIAGILLSAYPQISNWVSALADSVSDHLESANNYTKVLETAGSTFKDHSWSWTSIGDTLLSVVAILVYFILYITVYFFDAAIVYCLVLLYVFSPIMIAFYILPQTASMTSGLFRSLFEVAAWKIVFAVLGTLLWSTALHDFNTQGNNFITLLALSLMLAFSLLLTPLVVRQMMSGAISGMASQVAGLSAAGLTAGVLTPATLSKFTKAAVAKPTKFAAKQAWQGAKGVYRGVKSYSGKAQNHFNRKINAQSEEKNSDSSQ